MCVPSFVLFCVVLLLGRCVGRCVGRLRRPPIFFWRQIFSVSFFIIFYYKTNRFRDFSL